MSAEAEEKSAEKGKHVVWSDHIAENQYVERQAAIAEDAAWDPSVAGEAAVDLVGAAGVGKAAQHWKAGSMLEAVNWWWAVVEDRYDKLEVRQIGDVWWWQKQRMRQRAVVQQWQKVAAKRKAGKVAKAVAEACSNEDSGGSSNRGSSGGCSGRSWGNNSRGSGSSRSRWSSIAVDWSSFLAAAAEAEEEWWQQQAADKDMMQWVQEMEQQAATGEAEMVGSMVEAATLRGRSKGLEATEVEVGAAEVVVLGAAVEPVVWDTGEAVAEAMTEAAKVEVGAAEVSRDKGIRG